MQVSQRKSSRLISRRAIDEEANRPTSSNTDVPTPVTSTSKCRRSERRVSRKSATLETQAATSAPSTDITESVNCIVKTDESALPHGSSHSNLLAPVIKSSNVATSLNEATLYGDERNSCARLKQIATSHLVDKLSSLRIHRTASPFNRRITCLCWMPDSPQTLAIGCKAGQIFVWNLNDENESRFLNRTDYGPGYAIYAMRFHRQNSGWLYVACGDGSVTREDMNTHTRITFAEPTADWITFSCSLDTSPDAKLLLSGDNKGFLTMHSHDGQKARKVKLHQNKVTHVEFHGGGNRIEWLFATSSSDHKVKLWDLRYIRGSVDALHTFKHETGVNNATFNLCDGTKLLTTDQYGQVRVYSGPLWTLDHIIRHPHRHYQHLTPIKASWHPLADVVTIGRYPDPKFPDYVHDEPRSIDFFGASEGSELFRLSDWDMKGIASLNHFNLTGDTMASAMGYNILIWKPKKLLDGDADTIGPSADNTEVAEDCVFGGDGGDSGDVSMTVAPPRRLSSSSSRTSATATSATREHLSRQSSRTAMRKISSALEADAIPRRRRK